MNEWVWVCARVHTHAQTIPFFLSFSLLFSTTLLNYFHKPSHPKLAPSTINSSLILYAVILSGFFLFFLFFVCLVFCFAIIVVACSFVCLHFKCGTYHPFNAFKPFCQNWNARAYKSNDKAHTTLGTVSPGRPCFTVPTGVMSRLSCSETEDMASTLCLSWICQQTQEHFLAAQLG